MVQNTYAAGQRRIQFGEHSSLFNFANRRPPKTGKTVLDPRLNAYSDKRMSMKVTKAKQPVPPFYTYDGAEDTLGNLPKVNTHVNQLLPNNQLTEQRFMDWQRVGSKKGWMFYGRANPSGPQGENFPTHFMSDKLLHKIPSKPIQMTPESQDPTMNDLQARLQINNARGIGITGPSAGLGGMAGGRQEITPGRLVNKMLPNNKFNYFGTRPSGTGREDNLLFDGSANGAGGYRAGWNSLYPLGSGRYTDPVPNRSIK